MRFETYPSDAALVASARAGESWAKEALFRRHARMAAGLALRLTRREDDVDDLVQESFLHAFAGLARLESPQAFSSWLGGIVVRRAYRLLRRRRLRARLGFVHAAAEVEWAASHGAPPDAARELREIYGRIEALPADLRTPLVLRRIEGRALEEIATLTRSSLATVKRRIKDAEDELGLRDDEETTVSRFARSRNQRA